MIHERGGRNAYERHMSFWLHALPARTRVATGAELRESIRGTEGGPCYRWHRALSCALSHRWRLCGQGLMYGLLHGSRHAITSSHSGARVLERAQTNSVACHKCQKKVLTPICHHIHNIRPINYPKTACLMRVKGSVHLGIWPCRSLSFPPPPSVDCV